MVKLYFDWEDLNIPEFWLISASEALFSSSNSWNAMLYSDASDDTYSRFYITWPVLKPVFWSSQKSQNDEIMIFRIKIFGIFRFPNKKKFEFFFINSSSISKKINFFFQNVDKTSKNPTSFALSFVSLALLRASKNRFQQRPC